MITNLKTQLSDILGGDIISIAVRDQSFACIVEYTEKHPLFANKVEKFEDKLSELFNVNKIDILLNIKNIPPKYGVLGIQHKPGTLELTVVINNIPKYIVTQISEQNILFAQVKFLLYI